MFLQNTIAEATPAPSFERPIDLVHLARQTLGDRALEREILGLFVVQARSLVERLDKVREAKTRMDLAHTLKGSARAVGAWRVAYAAQACEYATDGPENAWQKHFDCLISATCEACLAIEEMDIVL